MRTIRKFIKVIAAFLFVNTLCYVFFPTVALALTSGPTAPEYSSFEPFDTTDMVNPSTGDLAYNMPLLEVPGPAGGYPLSLSYHAGISPGLEASWVGLGWTLNPGAINRNVNGYADDFDGVDQVVRDYWAGGEYKSGEIGLTLGIANSPIAVTAGLEIAEDTYRGKGIGGYLSVGGTFGIRGLNKNYSPSAGGSFTIGTSPFGDVYMSSGINLGMADAVSKFPKLAGGVGLSYSTRSGVSAGMSGGVSYGGSSILGASISSSGGASYSVGGVVPSTVSNSKAGKMTTNSIGFNFSVDIPTGIPGLSLRLGRNFQRYFSDESETVQTFGALNSPVFGQVTDDYFDTRAGDVFDNIDMLKSVEDNYYNEYIDPSGSFVSYDQYIVTGQGIGGQIKPHHYSTFVSRQNQMYLGGTNNDEDRYNVKNYHLNELSNQKLQFRFLGDFSNRLEYDMPVFTHGTGNRPLELALDRAYSTGNIENDGYNIGRLYGSKHVDYLSNGEFANSSMILETSSSGFDRSEKPADQIGGFVVTNESGVSYHYALPAYSYQEEVYTRNKDDNAFNNLKKHAPYAYTWLLTAVTGPDFVDRGNADGSANGVLDEDDWGYWVEFDYGLWTNNYNWRNPGIGFHNDLDSDFKYASKGVKELYYLDAVRTKSHTAFFSKEIREDGKGNSANLQIGVPSGLSIDENNGKFIPYDAEIGSEFPDPVLKLNRIYLVENSQLESIPPKDWSSEYNVSYLYTGSVDRTEVVMNGDNVLDIHDISATNLEQVATKVIQFSGDYSTMQGTPNSFSNDVLYNQFPSYNEVDYDFGGKYTLKEVKYLGKGGAEGLVPPTRFEYELDNALTGTSSITVSGDNVELSSTGEVLGFGDIIMFERDGITYNYYIKNENGPVNNKYMLGAMYQNALPDGIYPTAWTVTKNPDYNKDAKDSWGFFKSDYVDTENSNFDRVTTPVSAQNVDVWSLRKVVSPLGSEVHIAYEPDDFSEITLANSHSIVIEDIERLNWDDFEITFSSDLDLYEVFGEAITNSLEVEMVVLAVEYDLNNPNTPDWRYFTVTDKATISAVNTTYNKITFRNRDFVEQFYEQASSGHWIEPVGGNVQLMYGINQYGGGLRTKSISISDPVSGNSNSTNYNYTLSTGISSGVTPYEAVTLDKIGSYTFQNDEHRNSAEKALKQGLYKGLNDLLRQSRDIPGPGVMYGTVTVSESYQKDGEVYDVPAKSVYEYQTFEPSMVGINQEPVVESDVSGSTTGLNYDKIKSSNIEVHNLIANMGQLKSITLINKDDVVLSKTINHYLYDQVSAGETLYADYHQLLTDKYNGQGLLAETVANARLAEKGHDVNLHEVVGVMTQKIHYPSIQMGQTNINYKNGGVAETRNVAFDFFSGQATTVYTEDGYGNKYVTVSTPAYQLKHNSLSNLGLQYRYMGLKDEAGKNMLTQPGAAFTFMLDETFDPDVSTDWQSAKKSLIGGNVQTWSEGEDNVLIDGQVIAQDKIFRKQANWVYIGDQSLMNDDGSFNDLSLDEFEFAYGTNEPADLLGWRKNGEVTLYDMYSHGLEAVDINGNSASTKFDLQNHRVLSTATHSTYYEHFYSGAEDYEEGINEFGGGVIKPGSAAINTTTAHTGSKSIEVLAGKSGFRIESDETELNKTYLVQVWSDQPDALIYYRGLGDLTVCENIQVNGPVNGWYLISGTVTSDVDKYDGNNLVVKVKAESATTHFDDFRFFPLASGMTSYVYNEWGELSATLDRSNLATIYQYDEMGRLKSIWTESFKYGLKKISETEIKYAKQN